MAGYVRLDNNSLEFINIEETQYATLRFLRSVHVSNVRECSAKMCVQFLDATVFFEFGTEIL